MVSSLYSTLPLPVSAGASAERTSAPSISAANTSVILLLDQSNSGLLGGWKEAGEFQLSQN